MLENYVKKIILSTLILSLLAACQSTPVQTDDKTAAAQPGATTSTTNTGAVTQGATTVTKGAADQQDQVSDPNKSIAERSVYFGFDQSLVEGKYRALIQANAAYLKAHPEAKAKLEGNTDERGGSEYNLALGQRRAEAVRKQMALLGASDNQMEAISFGKERPKAAGGNEAAWEQNRRADINYQSK
jgi:peptidoglycan-associated lipoprotein